MVRTLAASANVTMCTPRSISWPMNFPARRYCLRDSASVRGSECALAAKMRASANLLALVLRPITLTFRIYKTAQSRNYLSRAAKTLTAQIGMRVGCEDARVSELIGIGAPANNSDFSYLQDCAKPKLFVQGSQDPYGSDRNARWLRRCARQRTYWHWCSGQ